MTQRLGLGPILAATITVHDLHSTEKRYLSVLGLQKIEEGVVTDEQALSWGAPGMAQRHFVILQPQSGEAGWIRLIEGNKVRTYRPLGHYGWSAIEIIVRDTEEVHRRMQKSDFQIIGEPRPLSSSPDIRAMQVLGPDGEVLYLTNVPIGASPRHQLPVAISDVDRIFIMVLGTPDFSYTHETYSSLFNLLKTTQTMRGRNFVGDGYGLKDEGQDLRMSTIQLNDCSLIQVDEMQLAATERPCRDGELPPGIAMVTFAADGISHLQEKALGPAIRQGGELYGAHQSLTLQGSGGEILELVDLPKKIGSSAPLDRFE